MDIVFTDKKFEKQCNAFNLLQRKQGKERAKRINRRLGNLRAANTLAEMKSLPGRCHELTGDRTGQLSLDLDHPYRLIFELANNPIPRKEDGGMDWTKITAVRIIGVVNTHE